jgi:hypothetical protein
LQQQHQQQQQPAMGIQSQRHDGSIASARRRGTKTNHKLMQTAISGGIAFAPHLHCPVCKACHQKATGIGVNEPHRSHHERCPKKGGSEQTVEVERLAKENILCNKTLYDDNQPTLTREQAGAMTANYFIPRANTAIRFFQETLPATTPSIPIASNNNRRRQRYRCCTGQEANCRMTFSKQTRAELCKARKTHD